jgi:hypothetical protein
MVLVLCGRCGPTGFWQSSNISPPPPPLPTRSFAYQGTDLSAVLHREYASNTSAHNTLTLDGCDQLPLPAVASAPVPNASWSFTPPADHAYGSMSLYNGLKGTGTHTRGVYYSRPPAGKGPDGDWLVVVDAISGDRARSVQARWHAHPNTTGTSVDSATGVAVVGGVVARTGQPSTAQACVIPATGGGAANWARVSIVSGQMADPSKGMPWAGWFSQSYDDANASPTLVYEGAVPAAGGTFAWLLVPTGSRCACDHTIVVQSIGPKAVTVKVTVAGVPTVVAVPLAE